MTDQKIKFGILYLMLWLNSLDLTNEPGYLFLTLWWCPFLMICNLVMGLGYVLLQLNYGLSVELFLFVTGLLQALLELLLESL